MKKGFWIWNIPNCEGGDGLKMAAEAVKAGLSDVFIKVADGVVKFNAKNGDLVPAVVTTFRSVGIRVWGWQYVYGGNPSGEEKIATARIKELSLDGFVVDAEAEFKKSGYKARAETYLKALRANNPNVEIAFSSFRFPHYHMDFPWEPFFAHCDINMPQVYWEQAHNAGHQLSVCLQRFRAMSKLPILPIGAAYKWNGWRPSLSEVKDFEQVALSENLPLISYWSWEHCRRDLPELWPVAEVPKDPITGLEQRIAALKVPISELKAALIKLESLVSQL